VADQESPWKELLMQRLPGALEFLRPEWHADADWSQDHDALEQELRQLLPEGQVGKRIADHLVKLMMKKGDPRYAHIEVQGRKERGFGGACGSTTPGPATCSGCRRPAWPS
jgi:hypothetical protein